MGAVISRRDFPAIIKKAQQGVFLLASKVNAPTETVAVNIGLLLSEKMFNAKTTGQIISITDVLEEIVSNKRGDLLLVNTDILFSPAYRLDVIKLLLLLSRNRKFYLNWPGEISSTRLVYSEPDRFDFKEYNIKDYVDTYVVLR